MKFLYLKIHGQYFKTQMIGAHFIVKKTRDPKIKNDGKPKN